MKPSTRLFRRRNATQCRQCPDEMSAVIMMMRTDCRCRSPHGCAAMLMMLIPQLP
ncbi:hypothetical protein BD414DRAFT_1728 [Trametes punicea]|nr:hypothetical protein BD414DRAFT_1728 [Trametes punicea]